MKRSILIVGLLSIFYSITIGTPALQAQPYPSHPIQLSRLLVHRPSAKTSAGAEGSTTRMSFKKRRIFHDAP